jgi:hypothetical protein
MGFRFHRSIKVLPGLRLNIGKRGVSASIGVRGARVTFGKTGARTTLGVPGSGVSYTHLNKPHPQRAPVRATRLDPEISQDGGARGMLWISLTVAVVIAAILVHLAQP